MRQFHKDGFRNARPLVVAVVVLSVMTMSGCHWFKRGNPYQQSAQTRPLEVPPDLDTPPTTNELAVPQADEAWPW